MNTLDIIILVIIGLSILNGFIKGFIKTLFGLTSLLIAVILTWMITPYVSQMVIDETSFDEMISEKVVELLDIEKLVNVSMNTEEATDAIEGLSLPGNLVESLIENYTPQIIEGLNSSGVGDYIGGALSVVAVNALVYLVVFVVISLALNAVVTLLDLVARLPVLKQMNKAGGVAIGLVIGVVIVWIGTLGLSFVISIQSTSTLSELIESSVFTKLFYYNNPLQHFVMNIPKYLGL